MSEDFSSNIENELAAAEKELAAIDARRKLLLDRIRSLRDQQAQSGFERIVERLETGITSLTNFSTEKEKIGLFRSLFRGREDVYPRRFESTKTGKKGYLPVCQNEWITGVCQKPRIRCEQCNHRMFAPVTDEVVRNHLTGFDPKERSGKDFVMGVYPLLSDDTCWFLAVDFDKSTWQQDSAASCRGIF